MSALIERGDVQAIKEAMEHSLAPESQSFEQGLYELLQKSAVTREDALASADSKTTCSGSSTTPASLPINTRAWPRKRSSRRRRFQSFTLSI